MTSPYNLKGLLLYPITKTDQEWTLPFSLQIVRFEIYFANEIKNPSVDSVVVLSCGLLHRITVIFVNNNNNDVLRI